MVKTTPVPTIVETCELENAPAEPEELVSLSVHESDDNKSRNEAMHTPASFNMNKFITCFKSEPNLSKALIEKNDNAPMLNRGRFIAKKLLGGVSMVNLRFPFGANMHEKKSGDEFTPKSTRATASIDRNGDSGVTKKIVFDDDADGNDIIPAKSQFSNILPNESNAVPPGKLNDAIVASNPNNIDDDEDDVDFDEKENLPDVECDQPIYLEKLKQASIKLGGGGGSSVTTIGCPSRDNVSMSDSMIGDSVSPITKSTHRMSKAMQVKWEYELIIMLSFANIVNRFRSFARPQESIMTPRSRKPVIIGGAMLGISGENYHKSIMNFVKDDGSAADDEHNLNKSRLLNASLQRSRSESDLLPALNACLTEERMLDAIKKPKSTSEETLSTPFR